MYDHQLYKQLNQILKTETELNIRGSDHLFFARLQANAQEIQFIFKELYNGHPKSAPVLEQLFTTIVRNYAERPASLKERDLRKEDKGAWFLSNSIAGMSLYVDRFCGSINKLSTKLNYLEDLGVNLLHLMPLFESPESESDGGYAVNNFRKIAQRFGSLADLKTFQQQLQQKDMFLMLDIVMNHTSQRHEWAEKARQGDKEYQDYFYFFNDRTLPDLYEQTMPEIFPESSPGNFTYVKECDKWVMTVFHSYQWDLNYANPRVLVEMLDIMLFYANVGVDVLRIDAPAFIWKQLGTNCQNLPQVHRLLELIKLCIQVAAPGMAVLGEAIVAPREIIKYFGTGRFTAHECDFAYNATQMALQWDALATGDTRIMRSGQTDILKKPLGTSWITYTRCHDDIGLAYNDETILDAGFNPYMHRSFLKDYYSGMFPGSPATGALFSSNPKTGDARISGTLASLCGLEKAIEEKDEAGIGEAIKKITLMQAQSFFIGGVPMLFYGDEVGYTNDYSYLDEPGKSYDNRWMHRPVTDWTKNLRHKKEGTIEARIFSATKKLLSLRKKLPEFADYKNIRWRDAQNDHVALFERTSDSHNIFAVFNFSSQTVYLPVNLFKEGDLLEGLYDQMEERDIDDATQISVEGYGFRLLQLSLIQN